MGYENDHTGAINPLQIAVITAIESGKDFNFASNPLARDPSLFEAAIAAAERAFKHDPPDNVSPGIIERRISALREEHRRLIGLSTTSFVLDEFGRIKTRKDLPTPDKHIHFPLPRLFATAAEHVAAHRAAYDYLKSFIEGSTRFRWARLHPWDDIAFRGLDQKRQALYQKLSTLSGGNGIKVQCVVTPGIDIPRCMLQSDEEVRKLYLDLLYAAVCALDEVGKEQKQVPFKSRVPLDTQNITVDIQMARAVLNSLSQPGAFLLLPQAMQSVSNKDLERDALAVSHVLHPADPLRMLLAMLQNLEGVQYKNTPLFIVGGVKSKNNPLCITRLANDDRSEDATSCICVVSESAIDRCIDRVYMPLVLARTKSLEQRTTTKSGSSRS